MCFGVNLVGQCARVGLSNRSFDGLFGQLGVSVTDTYTQKHTHTAGRERRTSEAIGPGHRHKTAKWGQELGPDEYINRLRVKRAIMLDSSLVNAAPGRLLNKRGHSLTLRRFVLRRAVGRGGHRF